MDVYAVSWVLDILREVGARQQITVLAEHLPAAELFNLFIEICGCGERTRFGRELDGTPLLPEGGSRNGLQLRAVS